MTNKEAARILDPETTLTAYTEREYYGGFSGAKNWGDDANEACRMAAEALREQEKRGEAQVSTWISVKDRLPEKDGSYIVHSCLSGSVFTTRFWKNDKRWSGRSKRGLIDYWMELPKPPKED